MSNKIKCHGCIHEPVCTSVISVVAVPRGAKLSPKTRTTLISNAQAEMASDCEHYKGNMDSENKYNALYVRFNHLMKSSFIRSFDEWDKDRRCYKLDIEDADKIVIRVARKGGII